MAAMSMSVCAAIVQHHHNAAGKVEMMTARGSIAGTLSFFLQGKWHK